MTVTSAPWTSPAPNAKGRVLIQLPLPVLDALGSGDLQSASSLSDQNLTPYLISPECRSVWAMRSTQIKLDAIDAPWVTRLLVNTETGAVVGRAGFHGQPNQDGMVEIGYSIDPAHRRQGHARAALEILLKVVREDDRVRTMRASVRPDNVASRGLVDQYGFRKVGEQWDEVDGLEVVLEVDVS